MHNRDKYPEIWAVFEEAKAAEAVLLAKRDVVTAEIDALQVKISALIAKKEALNEKAMEDVAQIRELREKIARYAVAMGAKVASDDA